MQPEPSSQLSSSEKVTYTTVRSKKFVLSYLNSNLLLNEAIGQVGQSQCQEDVYCIGQEINLDDTTLPGVLKELLDGGSQAYSTKGNCKPPVFRRVVVSFINQTILDDKEIEYIRMQTVGTIFVTFSKSNFYTVATPLKNK